MAKPSRTSGPATVFGFLVAILIAPGLHGCVGQAVSDNGRPSGSAEGNPGGQPPGAMGGPSTIGPAPIPGQPSPPSVGQPPPFTGQPSLPPAGSLPPQPGCPAVPAVQLPEPASTDTVCPATPPQVVPLHAQARAADPIVAVDAQGVITTRGAGRVRGRHELEADFSLFLPLYFENRTYEFIIEDTVAAGGSTVSFTYNPVGAPSEAPTNLRVWKVYGNGNVFHANVNMQKIDARRSGFILSDNARERRPMRRGDVLEFEFGIFFDAAQVEGRTAYYTDTFRYRVGEGGLTPTNTDPALGELGPLPAELPGGDVTIPYIAVEPEMALSQMALNIQAATAQSFVAGRRLFHTSFLSGIHSEPGNPVLAAQKSKAGPLYNEETCSSCHLRNGRGAPPESGSSMKSMVVKVFSPRSENAGETRGHPLLGRQIQNKALAGARAEGDPTVAFQTSERTLADGTVVQLRKPALVWRGAGCRPDRFSMRISRPLVGLGLLEAVPESAILARADAGDCNRDVISGRPNLVRDPETGDLRLGRMGWKASKVSVRHQIADALLLDMGVTTSLFSAGECGQSACPPGAPELAEEDLAHLTTYMRALAVSPRRKLQDPRVQRGAALFAEIGCVGCHAPSIKTGPNHPLVELRNQTIFPYSDLLLHDMGPDLADDSEGDGVALPGEWRTPPLWSVGLTQTVSGEMRLLHDGRARSFLEAILWHGGEAILVRERAAALPTADREALIEFLGSL